jgi:hypothetical protein
MNAKSREPKLGEIGTRPRIGQKPQINQTELPAEIASEGGTAKLTEPVFPKPTALLDAFYHWVMSRS